MKKIINKISKLISFTLLALIFSSTLIKADKSGVVKIPVHNWSSQLVGAEIIGQLMKNDVLNEIPNYWDLLLAVLIGGQIGNFLNLKIFPTRILALITAILVIFVATRMIFKIF